MPPAHPTQAEPDPHTAHPVLQDLTDPVAPNLHTAHPQVATATLAPDTEPHPVLPVTVTLAPDTVPHPVLPATVDMVFLLPVMELPSRMPAGPSP